MVSSVPIIEGQVRKKGHEESAWVLGQVAPSGSPPHPHKM
jgi:hypothetical protein